MQKMFLIVVTLIVCFTNQALTVQLVQKIFNYKIYNNKIINIILIFICVSPTPFLIDKSYVQSREIIVVFAVIYYIGRLCTYFLIYRKINGRIIYVYLLTINTPQIYLNMIKLLINNYYVSNILAFLSDTLIIALTLMYIEKNKRESFINNLINSLPKKLYILILILMYISSIFVMSETKQNHEKYVKIFVIPCMIGLIVTMVSIIRISISETEKNSKLELLYKQMEINLEYYNKINKIYTELKYFRHDFKNHIVCIRSLIENNEYQRAIEYINELENMSESEKKFDTGNIIVDALMNDKSYTADNFNIILDFHGFVPNNGINNADLCIIISNAVDNAIEACIKDKSNQNKKIIIHSDVRQGYFFFKIENPIFEEIQMNSKSKILTSKEDKENHGFGIINIIHTAKRYNGNVDIDIINGHFIMDIQILLNNKE